MRERIAIVVDFLS